MFLRLASIDKRPFCPFETVELMGREVLAAATPSGVLPCWRPSGAVVESEALADWLFVVLTMPLVFDVPSFATFLLSWFLDCHASKFPVAGGAAEIEVYQQPSV